MDVCALKVNDCAFEEMPQCCSCDIMFTRIGQTVTLSFNLWVLKSKEFILKFTISQEWERNVGGYTKD